MGTRVEQVKVTADVNNFTSKLAVAGQSAKQFARDLDSADSRMGNLVQTGLALGPALVPIGAVAIPAITALSAGLGVAVLGAGSAILAFQGIGDALTAANTYAIDPSVANLESLHEKLELIGPAGRDMVVFLQDLRPQLQNLKDLAGQGLFPGLQDGLDSMLSDLPLVERVVSSVSTALGDIAASTGEGLASPQWRDFLRFLSTDSEKTMKDFAESTGNVAGALAEFWMAFDPLNDSFTSGLVESTQAVQDWSAGLSKTQGFKDFTDYLRTSGPQVIDTLGSLGNALVQLLEAAAPLGGPTLAAVRLIADTLAAIANSPAGPILIGTAAGLSAISRAIALFNVANGSAALGLLGRLNTIDFKAIRALPVAGLGTVFGGLSDDLASFNSEGTKTPQAAGKISAGLRSLGKAGAGIAGLTLLMTDLGDGFSSSNTLALGLTGTLAGPWGAAAGVAVGAAIDFAHANDQLKASLESVNKVADDTPFDFQAREAALDSLRNATQATADDLGSVGFGDFMPAGIASNIASGFTDPVGDATDKAREFAVQTMALQQGLVEFSQAVHGQTGLEGFTTNLGEIGDIADNIVPKLQDLGYSQAQIQDLLLTHQGWDAAVAAVRDYNKGLDTVPGRTTSVGEAIAALGDPMLSTAEAADALSASLDALFAPDLNLSQATDDWRQSLADLDDQLAKHNRTLDETTTGGRTNRDVIRQQVTSMLDVAKAAAAAGEGPAKVSARLADMRDSIIKVGTAAGLSKPELRGFLNELNLTPKTVRTIFEAAGISKAQQEARDLRDAYNGLPKDVRTDLAANGVPANATVASLMRKYEDLSRADATTIIRARDAASGTIQGVRFQLDQLHDKTVTINVRRMGEALPGADGMMLEGQGGVLFKTFANGGIPSIGSQQPQIQPNRGPGGILWAETGAGPWEAFISGHPGKRDRSRSIADETVSRLGGMVQWFADGGLMSGVQGFADGGLVGRDLSPDRLINMLIRGDVAATFDSVSAALHRMRGEAADVADAEEDMRAARDASRNSAQRVADTEKSIAKIDKQLSTQRGKEHQDKQAIARLEEQAARQRDRLKAQTKAQKDADKDLQHAEDELSKQRSQLADATQAWREQQQELIQAAKTVAAQITAQGAAFGGEGTSVTAAGFLSKLTGSVHAAGEFNKDIRQLRRRHVDEGIIAQVLAEGDTAAGLALADDLAHARQRQLNQINREQRELERQAARTGAFSVAESPGGREHVRDVNVKFTGDISTTDVDKLAKLLPAKILRALRTAGSP